MDAFFARNRLSAYLDGELSAAEAREVEGALQRDPGLKAEFDALRGAVEMLRAQGVVDAPRGFADRLAARLEREPMPVGWRRWTRQIRMEGVLLAAAALLVVGYVGHRNELPNLAAPHEAVATGGAFGSSGSTGEAATTSESPASPPNAAIAPASAPPAEDALPSSARTATNDGVLGNEFAPKEAVKSQSLAQRLPKPVPSGSGEVESWQPDWEKAPESAYSPAGATNTGESSAKTASPEGISFYSPAPFRYRVTATDEHALKQLAAIAAELGGQLQDSRGRPVAAWLMESGETRSVRVAVPAYNAAALAQRLREIGAVEAVKEDETLVTDPNQPLPIQVELAF